MKKILLFLLLTLPVLLYAQYPTTGNKQRLGWQTTGDGLVYRAAGLPSYTPTTLNNAYTYIDTNTGRVYRYSNGAWRDLSSEKYIRKIDETILASPVKDSLSIYDWFFVAMELTSGATSDKAVQLPVTGLDSTYAGRIVRVSALDSSATYNVSVVSSSPDGIAIGDSLTTSYTLQNGETAELQLYVFDTIYQWRITFRRSFELPADNVTGNGTTNFLPLWIAPFTLGTAGISDDGSEIQFARPTVLYGVNTAAPATYGTFGIDNTLGIERPTFYNGSAWIPWLAYSGGTNQYSYFSNSNTITSGTQLFRSATGVEIGDGNYFKLPSNSTVGSQLGSTAGRMEFNSTAQNLSFRTSTATEYPVKSSTSTGLFTAGSVLFADANGRVAQDNSNFYFDDTNNRLAINGGGVAPVYPLELYSNATTATYSQSSTNVFDTRSAFILARSRGTVASKTAVQLNDWVGDLNFSAYDGTNWQFPGGVLGIIDGNVSSGVTPLRISFLTGTNSGTRAERMTIKNDGKIGINNNNPSYEFDIYRQTRIFSSSVPQLRLSSPSTRVDVQFITSSSSIDWIFNVLDFSGTSGTNRDFSIYNQQAATRAFFIDGNSTFVGINTGSSLPRYALDLFSTNAISIARGTTAQRPTIIASTAPIRFNSDSTAYEGGYGVGDWRLFASRNWVRTNFATVGSIYTGFTPAADSGTGSNVASGGTLTISGSGGITTNVSGTDVTIANNWPGVPVYYVSQSVGNDTTAQVGNPQLPYLTLDSAIVAAGGFPNRALIYIFDGDFTVGTLVNNQNLVIYGEKHVSYLEMECRNVTVAGEIEYVGIYINQTSASDVIRVESQQNETFGNTSTAGGKVYMTSSIYTYAAHSLSIPTSYYLKSGGEAGFGVTGSSTAVTLYAEAPIVNSSILATGSGVKNINVVAGDCSLGFAPYSTSAISNYNVSVSCNTLTSRPFSIGGSAGNAQFNDNKIVIKANQTTFSGTQLIYYEVAGGSASFSGNFIDIDYGYHKSSNALLSGNAFLEITPTNGSTSEINLRFKEFHYTGTSTAGAFGFTSGRVDGLTPLVSFYGHYKSDSTYIVGVAAGGTVRSGINFKEATFEVIKAGVPIFSVPTLNTTGFKDMRLTNCLLRNDGSTAKISITTATTKVKGTYKDLNDGASYDLDYGTGAITGTAAYYRGITTEGKVIDVTIPADNPVLHIIARTIYDGDAALPDSTVAVNGTFNAGFWRVPESMDGYTLTKASFGIFDKGDMSTSGATYSFGVQKCNGSNMSCSNSSNVNFTPSSETELELSISITLNANDILRVNYQPPQGCVGGCGTENVNGLVVTYTIQQN